MGLDLDIEEVLLLSFIVGVTAATVGAIPIVIVWILIETGRSLWSLRGRWSGLRRKPVVAGGIAWIVLTIFFGLTLGGWFGLGLAAYLLAIGTSAAAHA